MAEELDDDMVKEFLVESYDNIEKLDRGFIELEKDPSNKEYISSIFRCIHTIKGTSGFFGFSKLEKLTHSGENLLSKLRDGKLALNADMATALLEMADGVRNILKCIESSKTDGEESYLPLIQRLANLTEGGSGASAAPAAAAPASAPQPTAAPVAPVAVASTPVAQPVVVAQAAPVAVHEPAAAKPADGEGAAKDGHGVADSSIRVDVHILDQLMNLVGELVLVRNRLIQSKGNTDASTGDQETTQRLNTLTTELQGSVMKTRMQTVGSVWSKFPRIVRDLTRMCGKQVRLEQEGKDTELDRTLVEAIKDPLTHIVRNSVDHGIETPEVRVANGKPAEGVLRLRAFHEGGMVIMEIIDDGAGVNIKRVKAKALEKELITAAQAEKMTEQEIVNLLFAPGFSTAEKVTNISGRGVGMDVVKTNIENIGGTVDLQSVFGVGTTLRIKIPLTLAIIPALVVSAGGERFAIPQVSLQELVRLDKEQSKTGIEEVYGSSVYRLRGQLLPLVFLSRELGLTAQSKSDSTTIVVLQNDGNSFGLVVDSVSDSEEIVVKPLSKILKPLSVFAGATIMGDGQVALILDVVGVGKRAHALGQNKGKAGLRDGAQDKARSKHVVLVFQSPDDGRMAIPIKRVARLEELSVKSIERTGGAEMVQYRGSILQLIRIFDLLPERRKDMRNPDAGVSGDVVPVVVITHGNRSVGLVIGRILDTIETEVQPTQPAGRAGILGCNVISERVTEILDVEKFVTNLIPDFFAEPAEVKA